MEILKLDVLLRKEPFKVALPSRCDDGRGGGTKKKPRRSTLIYKYMSQDDFLAQWDTSGHYIHNRPDWKDSIPSDEDATSSDDESANVGAQKEKEIGINSLCTAKTSISSSKDDTQEKGITPVYQSS